MVDMTGAEFHLTEVLVFISFTANRLCMILAIWVFASVEFACSHIFLFLFFPVYLPVKKMDL